MKFWTFNSFPPFTFDQIRLKKEQEEKEHKKKEKAEAHLYTIIKVYHMIYPFYLLIMLTCNCDLCLLLHLDFAEFFLDLSRLHEMKIWLNK